MAPVAQSGPERLRTSFVFCFIRENKNALATLCETIEKIKGATKKKPAFSSCMAQHAQWSIKKLHSCARCRRVAGTWRRNPNSTNKRIMPLDSLLSATQLCLIPVCFLGAQRHFAICPSIFSAASALTRPSGTTGTESVGASPFRPFPCLCLA